jgi:hypothetical protein
VGPSQTDADLRLFISPTTSSVRSQSPTEAHARAVYCLAIGRAQPGKIRHSGKPHMRRLPFLPEPDPTRPMIYSSTAAAGSPRLAGRGRKQRVNGGDARAFILSMRRWMRSAAAGSGGGGHCCIPTTARSIQCGATPYLAALSVELVIARILCGRRSMFCLVAGSAHFFFERLCVLVVLYY